MMGGNKKIIIALLLGIFLVTTSPLQAYAHTGGNHTKITKEAAGEKGYGEDAIDKLVEGNLQVDQHQGTEPGTPDAPGTNAHGMTSPGQSKDNAKTGSQNFKDAKRDRAIDELLAGNIETALEQLGKGTHTVQDELQHKFGVWKGYWSWWNLFPPYALWFYGELVIHWIKDATLTKEEKKKNVDATKKYLEEFEQHFMEQCQGIGKTEEECKDLLQRMKEWKK